MAPVAISLSVLQSTGSPSQVGWVMAANVLPAVVMLIVGGASADRWDRGQILTVTCLLSGMVQAGMAWLLLADQYNLTAMAILSAVAGTVSAFSAPALRGIVPQLVEPADLQRANATLATAKNVTKIGGPALAGILVATLGGGWALALDSLSFLIGAGLFTQLARTSRPAASQGLFTDLAEGWATFKSLRWVWKLSIAYATINLLSVGPWQVLGPSIIAEHHNLAMWGTILSVRAIGLVVASTALIRLQLRNPLVTGLVAGTTYAIPLVTLALTDNPWGVAAASVVGAMGMTISSITYDTTLQAHVPSNKLSRVASYDELSAFASVPVSQAVAGPVAAVIGTRQTLLLCGIGIVAAYLLPLLSAQIRTVSHTTPASGGQSTAKPATIL